MAREFEVTSRLEAPAEAVWARVTTAEGVNAELMPIVRMTLPRGLEDFDIEAPGRHHTRPQLAAAVRPDPVRLGSDSHRAGRARAGVPRALDDALQRYWHHSRVVDPAGQDACTVTDTVRFEPRLPFLAPLLAPVFRRVFRHRHRRLRRAFGGGALS